MKHLFYDVIDIIKNTKGRKETSSFVGRLKHDGRDLSYDEVNGILDAMDREGYLKVTSTWGGEFRTKIVTAVTPKGDALKFETDETTNSNTFNTYFNGSVNNSVVAQGESINQHQENNHTSLKANDIYEVLSPLAGEILDDSETSDNLRNETIRFTEELDSLKQGKSSIDKFKEVANSYIIGIAASMSTQPAVHMVQAIGQFLKQ